MIKSFKGRFSQAIFNRTVPRNFPQDIARRAKAKLDMIHAAEKLSDLASPPGNQLEALKDDRQGQHAIRINQQWRVCFVWEDDGAADVEIVDYH